MLPMYKCFEETDEELEPLPEENSPNYPQENKFYFASKKKVKNYLRNDKMSIHDFHDIIDRVKTYNVKRIPMCQGNLFRCRVCREKGLITRVQLHGIPQPSCMDSRSTVLPLITQNRLISGYRKANYTVAYANGVPRTLIC
jgi:hypothetical protein